MGIQIFNNIQKIDLVFSLMFIKVIERNNVNFFDFPDNLAIHLDQNKQTNCYYIKNNRHSSIRYLIR